MIHLINPRLKNEFQITQGEIHAFLNPYTYLLLRKQTDLLSAFDTIHFDGIALCKIYDWFQIKKVVRRSFDMTSIARDVFQNAAATGKTIAIVGTAERTIDKAVEKLEDTFSVEVSLSRHGYFESEADIQAFQAQILEVDPDILIVGMGVIRQEKFLVDLKEKGWKGTGFTCGGFLHQTADRLEYYPPIFDKLNLRWVYRIWKDPYVIRRYFIDYPKFLIYFTKDYRSWKKRRPNQTSV